MIVEEIVTDGALVRKHASVSASLLWRQHAKQMPLLKEQAQRLVNQST